MSLHNGISFPFSTFSLVALSPSTESIKKVLDKQAIKFVRAIKQDTRSGKSEDRILVRAPPPSHYSAIIPLPRSEIFIAPVKTFSYGRC